MRKWLIAPACLLIALVLMALVTAVGRPGDGGSEAQTSAPAEAASGSVGQLGGLSTGAGTAPPSPEIATGPELVRNGSADRTSSGWTADSDGGHLQLTRTTVDGSYSPASAAIEVERGDVSGKWAVILVAIDRPARAFEPGRTYRVRAFYRDLLGLDRSIGLGIADMNFRDGPTDTARYSSAADDSWRLIDFSFTADRRAGQDAGVHISLPGSGPLHVQLTGVSVRESADKPATVVPAADRTLSFDGEKGTAPESSVWNYDIGGNGWGNDELQTYTREARNASLDGRGNLMITARREVVSGPDGIERDYTSSRLTTKGKVDVEPGSYVEAPIRAATGPGLWPAFWLQGANLFEVGWPAAGELDVMEVFGAQQSVARQFIHVSSLDNAKRDLPFGDNAPGNETDLGQSLDSQTHLYGVYFDDSRVDFYIDRQKTLSLTAAQAKATGRAWPFGSPQFLIVNIAIGGRGGDATGASFPRTMTVGSISIWSTGPPFDGPLR